MAVGIGVAVAGSEPVAWIAVGCAAAFAALGFVDDVSSLSPILRLIAQVTLGALAGAIAGGFGWALVGAMVAPLVVNVVNFMDGINGITVLTFATWSIGFALLADRLPSALTALVVAGAASALGFLPENSRSRLFLGDSGSYLFGGLITGMILTAGVETPASWLLVAPLAPYLADVGWTLLRRAARSENLLHPHRSHVYQVLVNEHRLPHLAVAVWTSGLGLLCGVFWALTPPATAVVGTLLLVALHLSAPTLAGRRTGSQSSAAETAAGTPQGTA